MAGTLVRTIEPHSESDPVALLLQFLTKFGILIGRNPYYVVEATRHYPNLFATLVGPTGKARKGTAYDTVDSIMKTVDTSWTFNNVIGGCGSGEGLINAVRDPVMKHEPIKTKGRITGYEDVVADPGVIDKRLLVYESEFASVLKVSMRDGNILSMTLRQAWESGNLQNSVKTAPQKATNAHIGVIGHITVDEIKKLLTSTEAANGFGNRFLWLYVTRSKFLPDGGALSTVDMQPLVDALRAAHHTAVRTGRMTRDAEASVAWHAVYKTLSEGKPGLLGAILARGEAQVLRLSMIYALLDGTSVIRTEHLYAALAVWQYVEASVEQVFGATTGNKEADTLYEALKGAKQGKMSRWDIIKEVFHGHIKAYDLNQAIRTLVDAGFVTQEYEATGGRRKEYICYGSANTYSTTITRARTNYIELARLAVSEWQASENDSIPCEESVESEESPPGHVDPHDAEGATESVESVESVESPGVPVGQSSSQVSTDALNLDGVNLDDLPF